VELLIQVVLEVKEVMVVLLILHLVLVVAVALVLLVGTDLAELLALVEMALHQVLLDHP
jgi:hypothetical protein